MSIKLGFNAHGKGRVRLVKITKSSDGTNYIQQLTVQILLEGDNMADVYLKGDNSTVIATDTCKNTVYCLASTNDFKSIEDFGIIIVKHFLNEYPTIVNGISVVIYSDNWERLTDIKDSNNIITPHKHAFKRIGPKKSFTKVQGQKRPNTSLLLSIQSGFINLEILKTTRSGFEKFHRDRYASLPDVKDRLLGTSATVEWSFCSSVTTKSNFDFNSVNTSIEKALIETFAGPSDVGVYSPSVQQTLYEMGHVALKKHSSITKITLEMPNIHNNPFPLENYNFSNKDKTGNPYIFYPIDEPHGMIKAVLERNNNRSKL
mmetsp:Transcript_8713/g.7802  ORF Transcript_8713/g.7802 Transcript_8713/m.7802 type:complete len:317 (-) Transcript_8713:8-958(-)